MAQVEYFSICCTKHALKMVNLRQTCRGSWDSDKPMLDRKGKKALERYSCIF